MGAHGYPWGAPRQQQLTICLPSLPRVADHPLGLSGVANANESRNILRERADTLSSFDVGHIFVRQECLT
jgi:hypothetical protein